GLEAARSCRRHRPVGRRLPGRPLVRPQLARAGGRGGGGHLCLAVQCVQPTCLDPGSLAVISFPPPRFSAWATMPANTPARLHGLALDSVLDCVDNALGLVPFLVDAHATGSAPGDVLADEDHGGLGPPGA